jgi:hypothetical protein
MAVDATVQELKRLPGLGLTGLLLGSICMGCLGSGTGLDGVIGGLVLGILLGVVGFTVHVAMLSPAARQ